MITFVNPRRMTKAFESLMDQIRGKKIAGCFLKKRQQGQNKLDELQNLLEKLPDISFSIFTETCLEENQITQKFLNPTFNFTTQAEKIARSYQG